MSSENDDFKKIIDDEITSSEEYYPNPLVSDIPAITGGDEITQMVKALDATTATIAPSTASILGSRTDSTRTVFISDPFFYEGKLVKFGRFYLTNVEVPSNSSWTGYQDYYEDGRLMAFSITCNDSDMIPVCFVENAVGSKDVINDLSYKEAVWHGRGMTYGEATSTVRTSEGITSRDVSGVPLTLFPYISRYKDQFTGTAIYDDIKNTIDDKTYVMNFEPNLFVPYQRLYFDVFNNCQEGTRIINRLEIKRLIYVDLDTNDPASDLKSEFSQFNKDLLSLYDKINAAKPDLNAKAISTTTASYAAEVPSNKLYEDFIKYTYDRMNEKNVTKGDITGKKIKIADLKQQEVMQQLLAQVEGERKPPVKRKRNNKADKHDDVMVVKWN